MTWSHSPTQRRANSGAAGVTLVEVLVTIILLGVIMPPLCGAVITGLRSTSAVADRVERADDAERIDTYWTKDVQSASASATGVIVTPGPPATQSGTIVNGVSEGSACGTPAATETPLVSFSWGPVGLSTDANYVPQTTASWVVDGGPGPGATLQRRVCVTSAGGAVTQTTNLIATDFWSSASTPLSSIIHGGYNGTQNPDGTTTFCTTPPPVSTMATRTALASDWTCTINVNGTYAYQLTVKRRVLPTGTLITNPTVPLTGVGIFPGTSSAWAVGPHCALVFYPGKPATTYTKITSPPGCSKDLFSVTAISSTAAFAVGDGGTILRCSVSCNTVSAAWSLVTPTPVPAGVPTNEPMYAVVAFQKGVSGGYSLQTNTMIAVGGGGVVVDCSSNCASTGTWTATQPAGIGAGKTLTGIAYGVGNGNSNGVAYITALGVSDPGDPVSAQKGQMFLCKMNANCANPLLATYTASTNIPSGSGQLIAIGGGVPGGDNAFDVVAVGSNGAIIGCNSDCDNVNSHWTGPTRTTPQDLVSVAVNGSAGTLAVADGGAVLSCGNTINGCTGGLGSAGTPRPVAFTGSAVSDGGVTFLVGAAMTFLQGTIGTAPANYTALTCGSGC